MTHAAEGVAAQSTAAGTRSGASRRRRRVRWLLAGVLALAIAAPLLWRPALRGLGEALIAEDDLAPADVLVVSSATAAVDAFEAAALYRGGYAPRVFVPGTLVDPHLQDVRSLGIAYLSSSELARAVLERSGVPAAAIEIGSASIDGTETEAAAIAAYVARQQPRRLLVITARSHTARTRWLLRRLLPAQTVVMVRSPGEDPYATDTWWQSRSAARETLMECLRWINTLLGDLWSTPVAPASVPGGARSAPSAPRTAQSHNAGRSTVDSSELRVLYSGRSGIGQGSAPWIGNSQLSTVDRFARVNWWAKLGGRS